MSQVVIYHNPRCSKSRQTLALLEEHGCEPTVVDYIQNPPSVETLRQIVDMLGVTPMEIIRRNEAAFGDLGLGDKVDDHDALLKAVHDHPRLLERPIVVCCGKAAIGRPPENVLTVLSC